MTGRTLTLSALIALTQAKAIITNHCPYDVYLWSIPQAGSSFVNNLPLKPGARYEEPWRRGADDTPGIAIKISPKSNGISDGSDEVDFAYSIERSDSSKIWVDLSPVRGKAFDNNLAFYTCHGPYQTPDVPTRQCDATDEVELVLCDTGRTSALKDSLPLDKIEGCIDPSKAPAPSTYSPSDCHSDCDDESSPQTSYFPLPQPTSVYYNPPVQTTSKPQYPGPQPTSEGYPPGPACTSAPHCPPTEPTSAGPYSSPKYTPGDYYPTPPMPTSEGYCPSPKPTWGEPYHTCGYPTTPKYPDWPSEPTAGYYPPPKYPDVEYSPKYPDWPSKPTEGPYHPEYPDGHYPPPKPTGGYYPPPKPEWPSKPTEGPYSPQYPDGHYPPSPTEGQYPPKYPGGHYPPPKPTGGYYPPPKPDWPSKPTEGPYPPPHYPDSHYPPAKPTDGYYPSPKYPEGHYPPSKPSGGYYPSPEYPEGHHPASPTSGPYPPKYPEGHYPPSPPEGHYPKSEHPGSDYPPPKPTGYYPPSKPTDGDYSPPKPTGYYPPPKPTGYYPPPKPTGYYPPPKPTGYYPPPKPTGHYSPPKPTDGDYSPTHYPDGHYFPPHDPHYPPSDCDTECPHYPTPSYVTDYPAPSPTWYVPHQPYYTPPKPTEYAAPPKPTYQARQAEDANLCLARIVYPGRRAALVRSGNNTSIQARPRNTIPLSTVLQLEAAKHATAARSSDAAAAPSTVCDLYRLYVSSDDPCDEDTMKASLKEIYPHLCEPVWKRYFSDNFPFGCEMAKKTIQKVFPGVIDVARPRATSAAIATRRIAQKQEDHDPICRTPICQAFNLGEESCEELEDVAKKMSELMGVPVDFTSDSDACGEFEDSGSKANSTRRDNPKYCIAPFCETFEMNEDDCNEYKGILEEFDPSINYTTDEEACGTFRIARNAMFRPIIAAFLKTRFPAPKRAPINMCVLKWCEDETKAWCDEYALDLEDDAAFLGLDVNYTSDKEVCVGVPDLRAPPDADDWKLGARLLPKACLSTYCEPTLPNVNCTETAIMLKSFLGKMGETYDDVMTESETCPKFGHYVKDGRKQLCIKPICDRLSLGTRRCDKMDSDLEEFAHSFYPENFDAYGFTTDSEEGCNAEL